MKKIKKVKIQNRPAYVENYIYLVAKKKKKKYIFYASCMELFKAIEKAELIGGKVFSVATTE